MFSCFVYNTTHTPGPWVSKNVLLILTNVRPVQAPICLALSSNSCVRPTGRRSWLRLSLRGLWNVSGIARNSFLILSGIVRRFREITSLGVLLRMVSGEGCEEGEWREGVTRGSWERVWGGGKWREGCEGGSGEGGVKRGKEGRGVRGEWCGVKGAQVFTTSVLLQSIPLLPLCPGTRETAMVNAFLSAGAAHGIASACHESVLEGCTCDAGPARREDDVTYLQSCGDDVQYAIEFLRDLYGLEGSTRERDMVDSWNNEIGYDVS